MRQSRAVALNGAVLLLLLLVCVVAVQADVVWVSPSPAPSCSAPCGRNSTCGCPTIQEAVDSLDSDGGTVLVSPGAYSGPGNANVVVPAISLNITSISGSAATIIMCNASAASAAPVFNVTGGSGCISGFTLSACPGPFPVVTSEWSGLFQDLRVVNSTWKGEEAEERESKARVLWSAFDENEDEWVSGIGDGRSGGTSRHRERRTVDGVAPLPFSDAPNSAVFYMEGGSVALDSLWLESNQLEASVFAHGATITVSNLELSSSSGVGVHLHDCSGVVEDSTIRSGGGSLDACVLASDDSNASALTVRGCSCSVGVTEFGVDRKVAEFAGLDALVIEDCSFDFAGSQAKVGMALFGCNTTIRGTSFTNFRSRQRDAACMRSAPWYVRGKVGSLQLEDANVTLVEMAPSSLGAVNVVDQQLNATDVLFENNICGVYGAVALTSSGVVEPTLHTFAECTFRNNTSTRNGGGVFSDWASDISFSGCEFRNNNAVTGAGIALEQPRHADDNRVATVSECSFRNNTGLASGGAILALDVERGPGFLSASTLVLRDVVFDNCSAAEGGSVALVNVGLDASQCEWSNSHSVHRFAGLIAEGSGGGGAVLCTKCAAFNLTDSNFTRCQSTTSNGGALFFDTQADIYLRGVRFIENVADESGGAIVMFRSGEDSMIKDCHFHSNRAYAGGAMALSSGVSVAGSMFFNNSCTGLGGSVFMGKQSDPTFEECHFLGSSSESIGGTLAVTQNAMGTFASCVIASSTSVSSGGALSLTDHSSTTFINTVIRGCQSVDDGGAAYITDTCTPLFTNTTFLENHSFSSGGCASIKGATSPVFQNVTFRSNTANSFGGALDIGGASTASFDDCTFATNRCPNDGGAVWMHDAASTSFKDSKFEGNFAAATGGAILGQVTASANVSRCHFIGNDALSAGGAIKLSNRCTLTAEDSVFEQSTATDSAVINVNDAVQPIFTNCTFSNNTAFRHGGVVYCRGVAKALFNNCTLQQNEASAGDGGVAYLADGSSVELRGCEVFGNKAHSSGVLFAEGGSALITGCAVWNNQADVDAGVLTVTDGSSGIIVDSKAWNNTGGTGGVGMSSGTASLLIESCELHSNSAAGGGAVAALERSTATVATSDLWRNSGTSGGGAFVDGDATMLVQMSNITECTANDGGALYSSSVNVRLANVLVENNAARHNGGGLAFDVPNALQTSQLLITETVIANNTARNHGGGVYFHGYHRPVEAVQGKSKPLTGELGTALINLTGGGDASSFNLTANYSSPRGVVERVSIRHNEALLGGGVYTDAYDDVLFSALPLVTSSEFVNNSAIRYGGALFQKHPSEHVWMTVVAFNGNAAVFGGPNSAWPEYTVVTSRIGEFCDECKMDSGRTAGYSTEDGFATPPSALSFVSGCPDASFVGNTTITSQLALIDGFATTVIGPALELNNYGAQLLNTSDGTHWELYEACTFIPIQPDGLTEEFDVDYGSNDDEIVVLSYITLHAANKSQCTTRATVLPVLNCTIHVDGCESGDHLIADEPFDYCQENFDFWDSSLFYLVLGVMGLLGVILLLTSVLYVVSILLRKRREHKLAMLAMYEDVSLAEGEHEPTIQDYVDSADTVIPVEEITVIEDISHGRHGPIQRGVWRKKDSDEEQMVTIRCVNDVMDFGDAAIRDILSDAKFRSTMVHQCIVAVHGFVCSGPRDIMIVEQYMPNGNIATAVAERELTWAVSLKIAQRIVVALRFLHKRKIVHGNLHPESVLLDAEWRAKVSGFGFQPLHPPAIRRTPCFAAPEVLQGRKFSYPCDVYSFGSLLYMLYTGRMPYSELGLDEDDLRSKLLRQWELPDTSALPSQLEQLLLECWCLNPSARPTFDELQLRVPRLNHMCGGDGGASGRDSYVAEARDNMDSLRSFDVTRGMRIDTEGGSDEDEALARSLELATFSA